MAFLEGLHRVGRAPNAARMLERVPNLLKPGPHGNPVGYNRDPLYERPNTGMAKTKTQFVCQQCGRTAAKPLGRCPQCGEWNSMVEEVLNAGRTAPSPASGRGPQRLTEIEIGLNDRLPLDNSEFARVLGGGVVPGSLVLIGGDPGIGKSTLLLQIRTEVAASGPVL